MDTTAFASSAERIRAFASSAYGMFIPREPRSPWQRLAYEASYFLSLCRSFVRDSKFDAVMVFCPLAGSVAYAAFRKLFIGDPLWLNVQDLPADAASASGIVSAGPAQKLLERVQRWLFNRADVWSSISPVMVERLEDLPIATSSCCSCPTGFINRWRT